jgi:AcrR family transcriptional regulator
MQARAETVQRTRERILAVAKDRFVRRPYDEVVLSEIASAAEVSHQTLLNHFASKEGLLLAVADLLGPEYLELRGPVRPGDVVAAVRGLMRQYERYGDHSVHFVALESRIPVIAELIRKGRRVHQGWLEEVFGERLPDDPGARRRAVAALYAVTDVGTWKLLRRDLGHSRTETNTILQSMLRAVLAAYPAR